MWRVTQEFYGAGTAGIYMSSACISLARCQSHGQTYLQERLEMQADCVSMSWNKQGSISTQQSLPQITQSRKTLEERGHFWEARQEPSVTHSLPHLFTKYLLCPYYLPALNLIQGQSRKQKRWIFCLPRACTVTTCEKRASSPGSFSKVVLTQCEWPEQPSQMVRHLSRNKKEILVCNPFSAIPKSKQL